MAYSSGECLYACESPARCIVAQNASKAKDRWLVGTASVQNDNELCVLEYNEDSNRLDLVSHYAHKNSVLCVETSPKDSSLCITSHQDTSYGNGVTLYRMPGQSDEDITTGNIDNYVLDQQNMTTLHDIKKILPTATERKSNSFVSSIKWHKENDEVCMIEGNMVSIYHINDDKVSEGNKIDLTYDLSTSRTSNNYDIGSSGVVTPYGAICYDPHSNNTICASYNNHLFLLDTRTASTTSTKLQAHSDVIRDIDYNPNKAYHLVTAGDDRRVRIWDNRNMTAPLKTLFGHGHWVWSAKYNPFHDQLLLSGGSDNKVNLWRVASISSAPWLGNGDLDDNNASTKESSSNRRRQSSDMSEGGVAARGGRESVESIADSEDSMSLDPPDARIKLHDHHTESVYSVAWSPSDAWNYVSVSYDGRVFLNQVPSTEKYKILL